MRRMVARVLVLAVTAAGVLSVAGIVQAGAPKVSPTLSPPAGQGAVGGGDTVRFGGTVDPGATLVRAELRFLDAAGEPADVFHQDDGTSTNSMNVTGQASIVGGAITGQYTLPSLCPSAQTAADCRQRLNDGVVKLFVAVDLNGAPGNGLSQHGVAIDMVAPFILDTSLLAPDGTPDQIRIQFSEDVLLPNGVEDSPADWFVGGDCRVGRPAVGIAGQGSTRTLTLALAEDEDPLNLAVDYCPAGQRPPYRDRANRSLLGAGRTSLALDRVAPKVPQISMIAGRPGKHVLGNDTSPMVELAGLRPASGERAGHFGRVYLESGDQANGFQRSEDIFLAEAPADAGGVARVQLPDNALAQDGTYTLYGVARDQARCTNEADSAQCPNYSDGDLATYRLDTIIPQLLFAATDGDQVIVRFSESLNGTDDPAQWTVAGVHPTSVTGTGPERFLGGVNAPANSEVTWTRPLNGGYTDDAGNEVQSLVTQALDFIPPVINITDPINSVWTSTTSHRITGSVSKAGSTVEVFRNGNVVERHVMAPEEKDFAIDVPLLTDQINQFVLRATDALGNVNRQDTFLPSITQDSTTPSISVTQPQANANLEGGEPFLIRWEASDANFGPGPIDIYFSRDGGPGELVAGGGGQANDGEFEWVVPDVNAESGQIRIVVEDRVGFTAEDISGVFTIDGLGPAFGAVTVDPHHVAVQFTEPVTGTVAADEWTIAGVPAASASEQMFTQSARVEGPGISSLLLETVPAQEIGRNELPAIGYDPGTVPGREEFRDEAGNEIPEGSRTVTAEDGILPLIPSIETIAGQTAGGESHDATPDVVIGNIEEGDTALVFMESDGEDGFSGGDRLVGSAVAGAEGATVTTDPLGPDADYTLYATARDTHGNVSDGAASALYKLRSGILPQVPVIEEIAGQPADAGVTSNDPSPDVKVGDIAETFVAEVYVDSDGSPGFSSGDRKVGEATADKDGALVHTADLGTDGTYTLLAVTRNVVGNRSPGGDEATYILDMTSPAFAAKVLDSRHVAVDFTEPVSGVIAELEWRIDGMPANLTREPDVAEDMTGFGLETLHLQEIQVGDTPEISYNPVGAEAASPGPAELRDDAGNFIRTKIARATPLTPPGQQPPPPGGDTGGTGTPPAQPSEQPGTVPGEPTADLVCTIVGTAGNDILLGTEGPDVMCPQGGDDRIVALGGDDVVLGGEGAKLIEGGSGNDLLIGGNAADRIYGGDGRDRLYGKGASDRLFGGAGRDKLVGGSARDRLNGGPAIDACKGGTGRDAILRCEGGRTQ